MTYQERLLKEYSQWLQMRNYSITTYKAYMGSIRAFWRYCESKKADPTFEKASAVQSYLAYRLQVLKEIIQQSTGIILPFNGFTNTF